MFFSLAKVVQKPMNLFRLPWIAIWLESETHGYHPSSFIREKEICDYFARSKELLKLQL